MTSKVWGWDFVRLMLQLLLLLLMLLKVVLVMILRDRLVEMLQNVSIVLRDVDQFILAGGIKAGYTDQLLLRHVVGKGSPWNLDKNTRTDGYE